MSTYKTIARFKDLEDKKKLYEVGDKYPKPANKKISKKRLDELMSYENKRGFPLIQEIKPKKEDEKDEE